MKKRPDDIELIGERIDKLKQREALNNKPKKENEFIYATKTGLRVGTEMLSGVLVGAGIGYLLDRLFDTKPFMLVAFLFLGGLAGFLNVYRFAKNIQNKNDGS
jgi:ATP synthase protein I